MGNTEKTDSGYEELPDGARVLKGVGSADELEIGKVYFNDRNQKLALFLGKAISPEGKLCFFWKQIDSVTGQPVEGKEGEDMFALPLLRVDLPDGFLKIS